MRVVPVKGKITAKQFSKEYKKKIINLINLRYWNSRLIKYLKKHAYDHLKFSSITLK